MTLLPPHTMERKLKRSGSVASNVVSAHDHKLAANYLAFIKLAAIWRL